MRNLKREALPLPPLTPHFVPPVDLAAKFIALEKLVIELTLIAMSATGQQKTKLDQLLNELEHVGIAGISPPSSATCQYLETMKPCGKPANQETWGEEWATWIPVCEYHAAISVNWGFHVRKRGGI